MHFAFIPYGIKNFVDFVIEDLNHKYLPLRMDKDKEEKHILIQVQVRVLPFGIYELVFPKEYLNEILSAFEIQKEYGENDYVGRLNHSIMGIKPMTLLRKFLKLEEIPDFEKCPHPNFPMPDYKRFVPIIPLGIRRDGEITEKEGEFAGWSHEGI